MLSCDYDFDVEAGMICWVPDIQWKQYDFKRARKCCSCGQRIRPTGFGKDYIEFRRFKIPDSDIEVRIYGEDGEIERASWYMCFECGWRYRFLDKQGYAIQIYENMHRLFCEHYELVSAGIAGCDDKDIPS